MRLALVDDKTPTVLDWVSLSKRRILLDKPRARTCRAFRSGPHSTQMCHDWDGERW